MEFYGRDGHACGIRQHWLQGLTSLQIRPNYSINKFTLQTYIIFAVINAFMVPCVYFFYVSLD